MHIRGEWHVLGNLDVLPTVAGEMVDDTMPSSIEISGIGGVTAM